MGDDLFFMLRDDEDGSFHEAAATAGHEPIRQTPLQPKSRDIENMAAYTSRARSNLPSLYTTAIIGTLHLSLSSSAPLMPEKPSTFHSHSRPRELLLRGTSQRKRYRPIRRDVKYTRDLKPLCGT